MTNLLVIVVVFVVVIFSMMLHELAHGLVAYKLGDDTAKEEGRLTLNPLKHLDPVLSVAMPLILFLSGGPVFGGAKPVPINTRNLRHGVWGMALVAIAGPITNFLIAFVAFLLGYFTGWLYAGGVVELIFVELIYINLGFGIFNLIPIPPLDGSRVLYAIAPDGVRNVMAGMERVGIIIVLLVVVLFPQVTSAIIGGGMNAILKAFYFVVGIH